MYDIKHIKNLNRLNTLYLVFNNLDAYFKKTKMMLKFYTELWDEIKEQIQLITGDKMFRYGKDFKKTKFKTNNDLP